MWISQNSISVYGITAINSYSFVTEQMITAELCRDLAVVQVTSSQWELPIFGVWLPKNSKYDKDEIWHNWLRREGNPQPTFGNNRITGGFSPYGWNTGWVKKPDYFLKVCNSRICWHRIALYTVQYFIWSKTGVLYAACKYSLCSFSVTTLRSK